MYITDDQKRKIMNFDLPRDNWASINDGFIELLINEKDYTDRWRISSEGSSVVQEREYQNNISVWVLMCPDCRKPYNKDTH